MSTSVGRSAGENAGAETDENAHGQPMPRVIVGGTVVLVTLPSNGEGGVASFSDDTGLNERVREDPGLPRLKDHSGPFVNGVSALTFAHGDGITPEEIRERVAAHAREEHLQVPVGGWD